MVVGCCSLVEAVDMARTRQGGKLELEHEPDSATGQDCNDLNDHNRFLILYDSIDSTDALFHR